MTRGTTNGNARGSTDHRRRRREYLVVTYRADVDLRSDIAEDLMFIQTLAASTVEVFAVPLGEGVPVCRCYRCGHLMTVDTVTVDRIVPGCLGGSYRRENIRPACGPCNSSTGGALRRRK